MLDLNLNDNLKAKEGDNNHNNRMPLNEEEEDNGKLVGVILQHNNTTLQLVLQLIHKIK